MALEVTSTTFKVLVSTFTQGLLDGNFFKLLSEKVALAMIAYWLVHKIY